VPARRLVLWAAWTTALAVAAVWLRDDIGFRQALPGAAFIAGAYVAAPWVRDLRRRHRKPPPEDARDGPPSLDWRVVRRSDDEES